VRDRQEGRYGRHTHAPRGPVQAASGTIEPGGICGAGRGDRAGRTASSRLVLVVDDDRDAADSLALVLGVLGYRVDVAYGGAGAVEAAIEAIPDVAVLDLGMPGMDGYELSRKKEQEKGEKERGHSSFSNKFPPSIGNACIKRMNIPFFPFRNGN
jgi:Response regulator receiver domain